VLEHQSPAVDRVVVLAPAPVAIDLLVPLAAAALFGMKVVAFVISVHGP
jgi:hypothetical protein